MIVKLSKRSLISVSGPDTEIFLQSQFTNDIKKVGDKIQINAYCQHQGKIICIVWVFKRGNIYYLSLPSDVSEIFLAKLSLFKLMSKVEIHDVSKSFNQYGLINEKIEGMYLLNSNLAVLVSENTMQVSASMNDWELLCIKNSLPEIHIQTSEKFIPQELNLDIDEMGVSFTKGCYPGQEVVARMHYLGKPKRRLFQFVSNFQVCIGDNINTDNSNSLKKSGTVIRVVKVNNKYHLLATFEIKNINEQVFLTNDSSKPLVVVNA